jgi:polar amino acid transport system permease protein
LFSEAFLRDAREFLPILLQGCLTTIQVTLLALLLSTVLGFLLALMRLSPYAWLRAPATTFITVIRGIPIIVQLFYIYFVFPEIGITVNAFQAGFIGLGIAYSASWPRTSARASRRSTTARSRRRSRSACATGSCCGG